MDLPIVGRADELAQLRAALLSASSGSGRLVLVSGDAGIGKTRMATALTEMAAEYDVPVARGYAVDDPGMPPLWPWRRLARDVPCLAEALAADTALGSASARFAMFTDATDVLAGTAKTGMVLVLEDLHWADRMSLRLLSHLAGELAGTKLLVLCTFRDADGTPLAEYLPDLMRAGVSKSIRLAGLSTQDIAHWLRIEAMDVAMASQLEAKTNGNPLYVRLLVDCGHDISGHPELRRLVLARVPEEAKELLGAASVLGEEIDLPLLTKVCGLAEDRVGELLDQAVQAGILRALPSISFVHALVRDALYEQLAPSQRLTLHQRAAEALEESGTAGQVANHWRRAGDLTKTVHWARKAAASAMDDLAYEEAVEFAKLALQFPDGQLTLELAKAEYMAGQIHASLVHCEQAARLDPALLAEAALVITGLGDSKTLTTVDKMCAAALRAPQPDAIRARLLAKRALAAAETGTAAERSRELSAEALAVAEASGDPDAILDGIHSRHMTLCAPQFLAERTKLAERAVELAEVARQPLAAMWGHVWLVDASFQRGDLAAVDYELGQIEQFATTNQHALAWWHVTRLRATRAALVGDIEQAIEYNESARRIAERIDTEATAGLYFAFLNQIHLLRGSISDEDAAAVLAVLGSVRDVVLARVFTPITYALAGDMAAATATFEEFRHMPDTVQIGPRWAPLVYHIGICAILLDDVPTADKVYRIFAPFEPDFGTDGSGAAFCGGSTARWVGDLALATGRVTEAIGHYRDAVSMNAKIGARPFLALSKLGLAKALLQRGEHTDIPELRRLAAEAAAEFRRLDMPKPLAAADTLLRGASNASPLSRRETEVAELVGQALSNRQIAERLVLSERTVESHVRSILNKLGYSTRTEIATWNLRAQ
ncbi:AAA family ATPase [Kibdelosporangium philippinense]|uniref:AAA family ATPase n=1 Tax=Kibdelosporangium philippinense TaxID=211113 RepID=A0ABS8Z760_9PSEU|nr:LuxR family transcriptional regulator [Kibdelosporangium philippinense]MCE7002908.1 AAA family ATPase [Kibdelosporangium philippinense]